MSEIYENYTVSLTRREAEALNGSLWKHNSAVVIENVQKQILKILDSRKKEEENMKK